MVNLIGLQRQRLELFTVVAWFIWNCRNKLRLNVQSLDRERIFSAVRLYLSDFQMKFLVKETKLPTTKVKWRPSLGEMYKTNYDGVVFGDLEEVGIGVVVHNARGEVLTALFEKIPYPSSVVLVEVLATRRAAQFIVELGISQSVFEGDSEVVCKALKATNMGHSSIGQFVKDIMSIVGSLQTFSFSHTGWQGNCVAHVLAKRARVSFPLLVWMEHVPTDAYPLVVSFFLVF